jgi:cyclohexyl-isocyanide hydratase
VKIAFLIYDGMTSLDFLGVFDTVTRLKTMGFMPDLSWDVCARSALVADGAGLRLLADKVSPPLDGYDMVIVPGGYASRALEKDTEFLAWLATAAAVRFKVSVCTGSLLWGAAGFLKGRTATTHPSALDELKRYAAVVSDARVVEDGDLITARGVTSSLDLGLYLCEKLAGREVRERIARQIDYNDIS